MTKKLAKEIRELRKNGCTWRRLSEEFATTHPELDILRGHQLEGMELVRQAGDVLGEDGINW